MSSQASRTSAPAGAGPSSGSNAAGPTSGSAPAGSATQAPSSLAPIVSIPQTAPPGGLIMTMPPQTALPSYFKIAPSNTITFAWNFTSLWLQPTSLTVQAICNANGFTYPVGGVNSDGVIPGTATSVVWDAWTYDQKPGVQKLAQDTYTLHINDERGATALMAPGLFAEYAGLKFALYRPGQATSLSDWNCPDCSSAYSLSVHPGTIAVFVTFAVMVLSGWGLLRRALVSP